MTPVTPDPSAEEVDLSRFTSRGQAAARFVAQRGLLKPLVWRLTRVTVLGKEQLRGLHGGFIVVANHASHLDTPLIMGALPRRLSRYLAAGAAADYFFDVWWRRGLTALFFNAFPVQRTRANSRTISAKSLLQRGVPLLVFPEGTRSKDGTIAQFKPGAAALAASCDVPCLPIALIGVNIAHPRGTNWPKRGRLPVGVVFGAPMKAKKGETAADFSERLRVEIVRLRLQHTPHILGQSA
ncbi:MAG: 1-acyl-sn-glycerol-3-phosphate acyltransferase [Glaciihabitans sp.]|jgi:1-acyl-sn-glycerol-3-phosphate acyltransferase|nr:1-acyl-sn-glycerol-3-phosphate acyltransferase [Glaciihabitans sp.]MCU1533855.1 1-acyl-sn-glycerol-3-phosphate acyltransferase [Glaciihabitans sp.]MDQ1556249.1 1-acyl-sn-glycerol-3-phosphate acyltransferase [Actinomycetota bacterium]